MPESSPPRCLRCRTVELIPLDSPDGVAFFECPDCHREFAGSADGALTFRWGHLITLLLYPVIFEPNALDRCDGVAADFVSRQAASTVRKAIEEITLELDDPTQQLRDTLGCCAAESALRAYLRCVADRMEESVSRLAPDPELDRSSIDAEAIWYVLRAFRSATGAERRGAARYLGLSAIPYFRRFRHDPDLLESLEKALQEASDDPDPETAYAGREGLAALQAQRPADP